MKCLIKVYNDEPINNILSILSFKAEKAIFLYDSKYVDVKAFLGLEKALRARIPKFKMETMEINCHSIEVIYEVCKKAIRQNPDCFFDVTGAGEMCAIAIYLACKKNFTPIFTLDILSKKLVNVYGSNYLADGFKLPKMSFDTLIGASGASISGNNHQTPKFDDYESIIYFCNTIFVDISKWRELCFYIQTTSSTSEHSKLNFESDRTIETPTAKVELNDTKLLEKAEKLGLIKNLYIDERKISFVYRNDFVKRYMTDFGVWLEAYTYIFLKKDKIFDDVRMSVKINWQPENKNLTEITNEIDVVFFYGIHAFFVSCKLSEPSSESLQELSMYPNYFGGRYSRCILITLANIKRERSHILRRAEGMGIDIIDGRYIKSGRLLQRIKEILEKDT